MFLRTDRGVEKPGGIGRAVLENVRGFSGRVLSINSTYVNMLGRPVFPTIAGATDPVDLAVIVIPARTIPEIVRACVEAVVGAARIIAAGFKECGPSGAALEH